VQEALTEMREHLLRLTEKTADTNWDGQIDSTFKSLLANHRSKYRMASQHVTHANVDGSSSGQDHSRPSIELF